MFFSFSFFFFFAQTRWEDCITSPANVEKPRSDRRLKHGYWEKDQLDKIFLLFHDKKIQESDYLQQF